MFSKFMKFFEVKEDETLDYMDPDKLLKKKKRVLKDPLNQEEEDEFFRQLEEEENTSERQNTYKEPRSAPKQNISRESVLKKMSQCMKERDWNPKHHPKIVITVACVLLGSVVVAMILYEAPNPLIGKWKPQGKNVFPPTGDIEFFKDKVQMMGATTIVHYKIDHSNIRIINPLINTSITFVLKDDKNIESDLFGVKTNYRKVEK
ncbi:hypothetical protein SJPD1_1192 [Sulfurospirillum diekertiae]|uniref:Uncharacterized protein n=1 Tax=Sulfurospirillum diekertiae TaxID=1854492 RepID=A0A290HRP8_9BACT|nr:hypothetical protein [Sulfurospirillum diekertiae]ATB69304.1 hypothetical protein SJPD1_1192 [Sulfurospirillum diekertiae]